MHPVLGGHQIALELLDVDGAGGPADAVLVPDDGGYLVRAAAPLRRVVLAEAGEVVPAAALHQVGIARGPEQGDLAAIGPVLQVEAAIGAAGRQAGAIGIDIVALVTIPAAGLQEGRHGEPSVRRLAAEGPVGTAPLVGTGRCLVEAGLLVGTEAAARGDEGIEVAVHRQHRGRLAVQALVGAGAPGTQLVPALGLAARRREAGRHTGPGTADQVLAGDGAGPLALQPCQADADIGFLDRTLAEPAAIAPHRVDRAVIGPGHGKEVALRRIAAQGRPVDLEARQELALRIGRSEPVRPGQH